MNARHPGPTASLALALFHGRKAERLFVIVTVYIDESGTHGSPVTIVSGWVARLGQWVTFDEKWNRLLKRYGVPHFHSRSIRQSKAPFKGWSIARKQEFLGAAAKLGIRHLEFGFTILLSEDDYQKHYIAGHRPKTVQLDSRYALCFRYSIGLVTNLAMQSFKRSDLEISFVLESGHNNIGDADRIFARVKKSVLQSEQETVRALKTLTTGDKAEFPGLQIADAIAYSAFQHVTRAPVPTVGLGHAGPDGYMDAAKKIQRTPIINLQLGPKELAKFKEFILQEVEEKAQARRRKPSPPPAFSEGAPA
jgi:Protein of unknown function (DUF3800)